MSRFVRFLPVFAALFLLAACSSLAPDVEGSYPGARPRSVSKAVSRPEPVAAQGLEDGEICVGAWCGCDTY